MGQALSNILRCICGEAEDDQESQCEQYLLISPTSSASLCKPSTNGALLQSPLARSLRSDSDIDSSPSGTLVCSSSVDLHGDSITNGMLCQNILIFQQGLESQSDSSTTWALQEEVLSFSPSSDSYYDSSPSGTLVCSSSVDLHGNSSTNGVFCQNFLIFQHGSESHGDSSKAAWDLQQEVLISSPSVESLSDSSTDRSLDLPIVVDSNIDVVKANRQVISPLLELISIELIGKEEDERVEEKVSKGGHIVVDSNIIAVEEKRRIIPLLSEQEEGGGGGEEEKVSKGLVIKERWIKYFSSSHKILLVGEGDFSFSASLALAFGSATNMIATSLNSKGFLLQNYVNALLNIQNLTSGGCKVMHGVDATKMANHLFLKGMKFDRVVFNFPLAGFFGNESRNSQLCRNRKLVSLFLRNARKMITEKGQIHISHKSNGFFKEWNLETLASNLGLRLIEEVHFNYTDYPGYHTKYGFGGDRNFNCNPSKTYKFGLKNCRKQSKRARIRMK